MRFELGDRVTVDLIDSGIFLKGPEQPNSVMPQAERLQRGIVIATGGSGYNEQYLVRFDAPLPPRTYAHKYGPRHASVGELSNQRWAPERVIQPLSILDLMAEAAVNA